MRLIDTRSDYKRRRINDLPAMSKRELDLKVVQTNKDLLMQALVKKYGKSKALECFNDYFNKINKLDTDRDKKDFIKLVLGE
ncbi:MAG: hypothetical protein E6540_07335 [Enterococcus sp.]|nr:hypothetical protein [Enterococcus sp.]